AGRLPWGQRPVPGPHERRTLDHRAGAEDRGATPGWKRRRRRLAAVRGTRPRRPVRRPGGGPGMTEHDGTPIDRIDLQKELTRYMVERRVSRRYLLERIAIVGGAAALAPIVAACSTAGGSPSAAATAAATPGASVGGVSVPASAPASVAPTP